MVVFFSVPGEIVFSFPIFYLIYFETVLYRNLVYVSQLEEVDLVYDYLLTSQRESHSVPDMKVFTIPSLVLSHLELSRIEL